jgi:hypothetical protein
MVKRARAKLAEDTEALAEGDFSAEEKDEASDRIVLPNGAPVAAANEFVRFRHLVDDIPMLRAYRGGFYLWTGTHYSAYTEEELERDLYAFLDECVVCKGRALAPYNPTKGKVGEAVHALRRSALLVPETILAWEVWTEG